MSDSNLQPCDMLYIGETGRCLRTRFGEHRRAVKGSDAGQPVARHFNLGNHSVSEMKMRALCPISGSNNSRKTHEMRLISKLGTVHPHFLTFSFIISALYLSPYSLDLYLMFNFVL